MRAFNVVVRLDGKALHFCAIGRCSADIVCQCFERFADQPFSVFIRGQS